MTSSNKLEIIEDIIKGSPNRLRESFFSKNSPEIYNQILKFTSNIGDIRFPYKVWHWVNNEPDYIRCYCGERVSEKMNWKEGYKKYCSNKCSSNNPETKMKQKKTLLDKWGVDHYSKTEEYLEKVKETSLKKWGVDNYSKTEEYLKKSKETYKRKWGVDNFTKTEEYLKKSKETSLRNWGVEYPTQSKVVKDKIIQTNLKKWGSAHIFQNEEYRNINFNISNHPNYISWKDGKNIFNCDCNENHQFQITTDDYYGRIKSKNKLCTICFPIGELSSIKEKMLCNFISEVYSGEIIIGFKKNKMEIDIYLPQLKLGFEFNGIWWHSEKYKDKWYHVRKTEFFKEDGIRVIHIWEDDWEKNSEIIKSQIRSWVGKSERKIWARKCKVKELKSGKESIDFLNKNHIQGVDRSSIKIGLYYGEELVSIMTFDQFEGRKKMEFDCFNLSRFCNKIDCNVIGGASKLLKYFINNWNPKRIVSYADRDWSEGDLYNKLGFKLLYKTNPDYKYIVNNIRIHKSRFRKSKIGISESNLNITKIWDCGKIKFELIIK